MDISVSFPAAVTVFCGTEIEGVGFTAARKRTGEPSLIPPSVPPEWLEAFFIVPSSDSSKRSLFVLPQDFDARKPSPISKPLTAPTERIAFARFASSF